MPQTLLGERGGYVSLITELNSTVKTVACTATGKPRSRNSRRRHLLRGGRRAVPKQVRVGAKALINKPPQVILLVGIVQQSRELMSRGDLLDGLPRRAKLVRNMVRARIK